MPVPATDKSSPRRGRRSLAQRAVRVSALAGAGAAGIIALAAMTARDPDAGEGDGLSEAEQSAFQSQRMARTLAQFDTANPQIDLDAIIAGGPPKDGIPALTNPMRERPSASPFPPGARVVEVVVGGQAVAYPIGILNWHEIVNDEVGGVPIAVIYCPLCDSVSVVDRRLRLEGQPMRTLEFGVSGLLLNSNVVMFERSTDALWSQVEMGALTGPHAGRRLAHIPFRMTTLGQFAARNKSGQTLSLETGFARNYTQNPYQGYLNDPQRVFHDFDYDDRLPPKALGVGILAGEAALFAPLAALGEVGGRAAVETPAGAVVLERTPEGVAIVDAPEGVRAMQTFYHSWSAFHPETRVLQPADLAPAPKP